MTATAKVYSSFGRCLRIVVEAASHECVGQTYHRSTSVLTNTTSLLRDKIERTTKAEEPKSFSLSSSDLLYTFCFAVIFVIYLITILFMNC